MNDICKYLKDIKTRTAIYKLAYSLILTCTILGYSLYGYMDSLAPLFRIVRWTAFGLILLKLGLDLVFGEFSIREMVLIAGVAALLVISAYTTHDKAMLVYWTFIVGACNIKFDKIIKISLIIHIASLVFVILSCKLGVLENIIYYRIPWEQIGPRESLGFLYTTESINMFFYTILLWVYYRKDRIKPAEWIVMAAALIYLYIKTDTKNATALGLLAIIGSVLLKYSKVLRSYHKWYTILAVGIVPAAAVFIITVSVCFNWDNSFLVRLDDIISGRLELAHNAIDSYGIKLFGQQIAWNGMAQTVNDSSVGYNYVDSSYMQILINFGPVILGLIMIGAMAAGIRISEKRDTYMLLVVCIIAVHTTFDPQLTWIGYNSFVMLYSYFKLQDQDKEQALDAIHELKECV